MITGEKESEARKNCPHDVNAMLKQERTFMPWPPGSKSEGFAWCDDCKVWIPFFFEV
jgi:hypothetical protein